MKIIKGIGLALLGLILSLSITVFGMAYTVNSTVLNPKFIRTEINELDIPTLVKELTSAAANQPQNEGGIPPQELINAVSDTVTQIEPVLKEGLTATTDSIYDYLLGKRPNPDLAVTLRSTILKKEFFVQIIEKLDVTSIIKDILRNQLGGLPPEIQQYVDASLDKVAVDIKPIVIQQFEAAADPMLDYLIGKRDSFVVTINSAPIKTSLKNAVHDALFASPPPEFALLNPTQREAVFNQTFDIVAGGLPSSFEINQTMFDPDVRKGIADGIKQAEDSLTQARQYVAYFQLGYKLLTALMLLSILGIILIHHQVRGAARNLGTIFLSYGAVEYAGVIIGKYFAGTQLTPALAGIPQSLQTWINDLVGRLFVPLGTFSLACLIAGVVLVVASFVYPKRREQKNQPAS